jgi:hypothetical protein
MKFAVIKFKERVVVLSDGYEYGKDDICLYHATLRRRNGKIYVSGKQLFVDWNFSPGEKTSEELQKYTKKALVPKPYVRHYGLFFHKTRIVRRWESDDKYPLLEKSRSEKAFVRIILPDDFVIIKKNYLE